MNYYETLYIVHPALESGRLKDIILSIQEIISKMNIKVISTDVWGKKKLAYLIDKQKYGTYVLIQFEGDGQMNNKISVELEHNPNILSYLTSKISDKELRKDLSSLDEQIGGARVSDSTPSIAAKSTEEATESTEEATESTEEATESTEEATESTEEAAESTEEATESTEEAAESTEDAKELINENSEENHGSNE